MSKGRYKYNWNKLSRSGQLVLILNIYNKVYKNQELRNDE